MKKILFIVIPIVIVIGAIVGCAVFMSGRTMETVRCVVCTNGLVVLVDSAGHPTVARAVGGCDFEKLTTGDSVWILRDTAVTTSYPEEVRVFYAFKRSDGSVMDIPTSTLKELIELGLLDGN